MSKIELTIAPNYVPNWTYVDAVHKLFQNALDQATQNPDNAASWDYDSQTGEPGHKAGCESCPLGSEACAEFRRCTPNGECPCDVYDTYTDYIKAEEESE